ncbi:MAG TPA: PAS domain-containing sensor histidine kinase [Candidatus Paceibacterota bacterium]
MLKKRFFLLIAGFAFLLVIFNFSLISASLENASKIRLLSLSMVFSIFEISISIFVFWLFFKSASSFSKKEQQYFLVLNSIENGIVVYNSFNEVLFLNPKAEEILEIKFKDIVGIRLSKESSLRNHKLEKITELLVFSKLSGKENFEVENKEVSDGNQRFFIKTFRKITGTPKSENNMEFVTTAAHQLRTPLSGVKWVLKMLLENPGFNQDQISLLKKGQDTNEKVIKIVNDLLDAAKIESGKLSYDFKPVNPVSFIESLVVEFSVFANEKSIRLNFEKGTETIPNMKADADRLKMVTNNLIDNAIKYTPQNGEVKLSIARKNNFVEISVADTGIGIPQEERGKVFSKFFRAGNAVKIDSTGAGLGLFIASRIVSDHGGQLRFGPNSPQGSVFSFSIPLSENYLK